ncbi:hypothetical protein [Streptomyces sp. NPDC050263]|uniref:hypothetical protein n=1 Tax=Streptomyces sp. NPDC050263 TaxID=3155037 RepID=UPI00342900C0
MREAGMALEAVQAQAGHHSIESPPSACPRTWARTADSPSPWHATASKPTPNSSV